jgi:citrate lyase beta subunit
VAAVGGKMVDPPVRARAEKVLAQAKAAGILKE